MQKQLRGQALIDFKQKQCDERREKRAQKRMLNRTQSQMELEQ